MKIDHVLSIDYFHEDILEQITMLLIVKSTACSKFLIQYNITKLHPPPPHFLTQKEVHTSISFYHNVKFNKIRCLL